MLSNTKIKNLANSVAADMKKLGGPPGTPKANGLKKQFNALIATASIPDSPKQAVAMKEGAPQKPSSKKALKWANKKFGEAQVVKMAKANGMKPRAWALSKYNHRSDRTANDNDALQALANGSAKKREAIANSAAKPKSIWYQLDVSTADAVKSALDNFVAGPVKTLANAFVELYTSRADGDSDEAVLALDACRAAFDACSILLLDVETKSKKAEKVSKKIVGTKKSDVEKNVALWLANEDDESHATPKANETMPQRTAKKDRVRKEMTPAQREAKNKADRDRRAAKAKKS